MVHCTLLPHCIAYGTGQLILNNRTEEYRRLARECLRLVTTVATEEARRGLIEMARVWTRLAAEQEPPVTPRRADAPQAAVQQQQQILPPKKGGDGS
jgi:hypothetical protein